MPIKLPVPNVSHAITQITLGGLEYTFTYDYNTRDERWRFDISLIDTPVILGVKVMENQSLLARYLLDDFDHGDVFCFRIEEDGNPVGRDNLGIDLPYELVYLTNAEIEELDNG
jgi:hypothetical protein